jgi:YD repeat-containing protein
MSVRAPLYNNSGNIQEMTTAMVDEVVDQIVYQYSLSPSVALSVVSSSGSLGTISDTRLQAGASTTDATNYDTEGETPDVSTVTVNYAKIDSSTASITPTTDTGTTWPLYYNSSGQIQAMNLTDIKDTFLHPAIDLLSAATTTSQQAGTHFISSATSVTGSTRVSSTPVFSDTRADAAAYTAGGIGETQDQPTTITNYYLYTVDGSDTSYTAPFFINASNNLQIFAEATFESLIQEWIRYTAASSTDGYAISYNLGTSGSGNERGSGMADTKLNSSTYAQRFVNANDYRTQEFPSGSAVTQNTYYLRINKS